MGNDLLQPGLDPRETPHPEQRGNRDTPREVTDASVARIILWDLLIP